MSRFTMIDDLPDVMDLEKDVGSRVDKRHPGPSTEDNDAFNTRRHIRQHIQSMPPESGMTVPENRTAMQNMSQEFFTPQNYPGPPLYLPHSKEYHSIPSRHNGESPRFMETYTPIPTRPPCDYNCVDIASHVHSCEVCAKLYKSDRLWYIIAICALLVISLILLKKVLDM